MAWFPCYKSGGVLKQVSGNKDYVNQTNLPPQLIDVQETLVDGFGNFWTVFNIGAYDDGTPSSSYKTQLLVPYGHGLTDTDIFIRTADKDYTDQDNPVAIWRTVRRVLHDGNYAPYIFEADINGYCSIRMPDNGQSEWLKTPPYGLLPYEAGGVDASHGCLGTEGWYFLESYINRMHGIELYIDNIICRQSIKDNNAAVRNRQSQILLREDYIEFRTNDNYGALTFGVKLYTSNTLSFQPNQSSRGTIGSSSYKWNQVYAVNGAIQTSDRKEKKEISYIGQESSHEDTNMTDEQLIQLILGLKPVVYKRKNGESGRPHHGFIAQDFEELLKDTGIKDHAAFIKSPKVKEFETEKEVEKEVTKEDGTKKVIKETIKEVHQEEIPGEYTRGLRYEEFIPDIARFGQILYYMYQGQQKRIESLEGQLKEALNRIEILEGTRN